MRYCFILLFLAYATYASAQHDVPPTASFKVTGMVNKELLIEADKLGAYKQDVLGDVVMRNHRGDQKSVMKGLKGILLKTILDSAGIKVNKPKEYGEVLITLVATDGYKNLYTWNELFNTETGNHVYVITEMDGKNITEMDGRILVLSLSDFNSGSRHLKGLAEIVVKKE